MAGLLERREGRGWGTDDRLSSLGVCVCAYLCVGVGDIYIIFSFFFFPGCFRGGEQGRALRCFLVALLHQKSHAPHVCVSPPEVLLDGEGYFGRLWL